MKSKSELTEEVWAASNLTWRQADKIISEAMTLGMAVYQASRVSSETVRNLAA